jgi:TolB protein
MSTLKRVDLAGSGPRTLVNCRQAQCTPLAWSGDGSRAIYERRPLREDDTSGAPDLWWLDAAGGTSKPLLDDDQARATGAGFSPDGKWLSYISPAEETVVLYNLEDGRTQTIGSEIGVPPSWDPTGEEVVVPLLDLVIIHGDEGDDHLEHTHEYVTATHLYVVDAGSGERQNISGELGVEDSVPAYSPDGQWVAFGRRHYGTTANRQLWLMKADGTEQQLLLDDSHYTHGPPAWSPDGRYLLFQRFLTDGSSDKPGIWILNLATREVEELVDEGMEPLWLAGSL